MITFFNVVFIVIGVSAVACLVIAAFLGEGRARGGGPPRGSLEREEDEEHGHA